MLVRLDLGKVDIRMRVGREEARGFAYRTFVVGTFVMIFHTSLFGLPVSCQNFQYQHLLLYLHKGSIILFSSPPPHPTSLGG